jgi:hypothetical protein
MLASLLKVLPPIQGDPLKKLIVLFTGSYHRIAIQVIHFLKWITNYAFTGISPISNTNVPPLINS